MRIHFSIRAGRFFQARQPGPTRVFQHAQTFFYDVAVFAVEGAEVRDRAHARKVEEFVRFRVRVGVCFAGCVGRAPLDAAGPQLKIVANVAVGAPSR